jgi:hypothetical protein
VAAGVAAYFIFFRKKPKSTAVIEPIEPINVLDAAVVNPDAARLFGG